MAPSLEPLQRARPHGANRRADRQAGGPEIEAQRAHDARRLVVRWRIHDDERPIRVRVGEDRPGAPVEDATRRHEGGEVVLHEYRPRGEERRDVRSQDGAA